MDTNTSESTDMAKPESGTPEPRTPMSSAKKKMIIKFVVALVIIGLLVAVVYKYKSWIVAASVDGHMISRASIIKELEKQGGRQTLDLLIDKQLINNESKNKNITVSDSEVDEVVKNYESIYSTQGGTLDQALAAQGLSRQDLKDQIIIQKKVEKLLGDKVKVTDEEVQKFIDDNKVPMTAGKEDETKKNVLDQLKQQKLSDSSGELLQSLRSNAKIKEFVKYE